MKFISSLGAGLCGFALALALSLPAAAQDKDWRPISPEEISAKTPVVEPDADAEALVWEVRIDDSSEDELSMRHYVRVKIFTERGREKYSKFDVPFIKGMKIKDLSARVIKADGSIVDIKKDDIFEREIVRANGIKVKAKSFAVPNIEPGVIVEYRYKEVIEDGSAKGMRLQFQRDIPVQKLAYYYKPYNKRDPIYQPYNFGGINTKFVKDKDGYWLAERTAVAALREEDRMPPEDVVRPWMLLTGANIGVTGVTASSISYTIKDPTNPGSYWASVAADYVGLVKFMTKSSDDIKKAAQEITAGVSAPEDKLRKIYEFCQSQIENTTFDPTMTDEKRKKMPKVESMNDVLKRRNVSAQYVDMLFGALANAAGFEVRLGLVADRNEIFFTPTMTNENLIHPSFIAAKVGTDWKFFNPGSKFLPYGSLVWNEEDSWALVIGEKQNAWVKTPMATKDKSVAKRSAVLNLTEDGTVEGEVSEEMDGQLAISYRLANYDETPEKREELLKADIKRRLPAAEVSMVSIDNLTDSVKPLLIRYKVRVPNYAQKTGKRLFFQPGFFETGVAPLFTGSQRKYDIFFRHPWSEKDSVEIRFPESYALDSPDAPANVPEDGGIAGLSFKLTTPTKNSLRYEREFFFGGGGHVLFPATSYPAMKNLFDLFSKSDTHTMTIKQK